MKKTIGIIGGDLRQKYLAEELKYPIIFYANEYIRPEDKIKKSYNFKTLFSNCDIILTSIPFSKDNNLLFIQNSTEKISINDFINEIQSRHIIIGGPFSKTVIESIKKKGAKLIDITSLETFKMQNAIPTAEGVISELIIRSKITIYNSKILLLGFGNCGKRISKCLNFLDAILTIYSQDIYEIKKAQIYGFEVIEKLTDLSKYDFIINTIPKKIISKFESENIFVDITDAYDFSGERFIKMRGIPGNYSPVTSGKMTGELLNEILKNLFGDDR